MNNKDKINLSPFFIIFFLLLLILWVFLPGTSSQAYSFSPYLVVSEDSPLNGQAPAELGLFLGDTLVSLDWEGRIIQKFLAEDVLAYSSQNYSISVEDGWESYSFKDGLLYQGLDWKNALWLNGRQFVFLQDGLSLGERGQGSGEIIWEYSLTSPISSLDANQEYLLVGGLDGSVAVLNQQGELQTELFPTGSDFPIIYNLAISEEGSRVATISGLGPKRFIYWEKQADDYRNFYSLDLKDQRRYSTALGFLGREGRIIYFQDDSQLILYHTQDSSLTPVSLVGELVDCWQSENGDLIAALEVLAEKVFLTYYTTTGQLVSQSEFEGPLNSFEHRNNRLYLGIGTRILILEMS